MNRQMLNFQADRIESVLASHRVPARVEGGSVTPRAVRFHLSAGAGARISRVQGLSEELALALGSSQVRLAREGNALTLEVPRPDAEPVLLPALLRQLGGGLPPLTAVLGLGADGCPLLVRLTSPEVAHMLVAGTTGSGKTELMRTILLSLALGNRQSRLQIALIDPKARGLLPLSDLPHLISELVASPGAAVALLARLAAEMERRDAQGVSEPHILIAVDELLDLLASPVGGREAIPLLTRIAARGRQAGLHLLVGAQRPAAAAVGGLLKANFPVRLVGRVTSAEDARVATGQAGTGAEKLAGRGDFLAVAGSGVHRFQAAYVPARDWARLHRSTRTRREP